MGSTQVMSSSLGSSFNEKGFAQNPYRGNNSDIRVSITLKGLTMYSKNDPIDSIFK